VTSTAPASGTTLTLLAVYIDALPPTGIAAFDVCASQLQIP
jgi:hypothetical protein